MALPEFAPAGDEIHPKSPGSPGTACGTGERVIGCVVS
jgi:hypothetical protein